MSVAKGAMNDATRELMAQWAQVRETWRDKKSDEFGQAYLAGLGEEVSRAVRVMDELERLFSKIHADCD